MDTSSRRRSGKIASVGQRIMTSRRSRKADLSKTLFVDVSGSRSKRSELTDVGGPELESGKNPYGTARTLRFVALVAALFVLVVLVCFALITEFGQLPGRAL
jgi:hypothetical protein